MATLKDIAQLASVSDRIPCPQSRPEPICYKKKPDSILTLSLKSWVYQTPQNCESHKPKQKIAIIQWVSEQGSWTTSTTRLNLGEKEPRVGLQTSAILMTITLWWGSIEAFS